MPPARRSDGPGHPVRPGQTTAAAPADRRPRAGADPPAGEPRPRSASDGPALDSRADERPTQARPRSTRAPAKPDPSAQRPAAGKGAAAPKRAAAKPAEPGQRLPEAEREATKPEKPGKRRSTAQPATAERRTTAKSTTPGRRPATGTRSAASERGPATERPTARRRARQAPAEPAAAAAAGLGLDGEHEEERETAERATDASISPRRRRGPLLLPAVLGVVTVLLGSFAVWSGVRAHTLTSASAGQNTALTDSATTTKIIGQVTGAAGAIFSYNYADPVRTQRAGQQDLTGQATQQYRRLFGTLQHDAAAYKQLVLTTTVTEAGVEMLQGNSARVLIFANQVLTSASRSPETFGAMVALDLVQEGGAWKIDNIDTFTGAR